MRIFITGATGLIGRRLVLDRLQRGDQVTLLSRDAGRAARLFAASSNSNVTTAQGNPSQSGPWQKAVDGCDAVINLAGAGIADRRWNAAYKRELEVSRVDSTANVVAAIHAAAQPPGILINGSAAGYYGDGGDDVLDEDSPPGSDFLAALCQRWEQAALAAADRSRVVLMRTSIVLDNRGGALPKMARPFRFFVGGPVGNGRQYMPWIHWRDLIGLFNLVLHDSRISGPLNAASPGAVTSREFCRALGAALKRPSWLPAPRPALRLALGEVAEYVVMSQRISPRVALERGHQFMYPQAGPALESLLRKQPPAAPPPRPATHRPTLAAPRRPIRLVAIDVDGTLLRPDRTISQDVITACRAAQRAGCSIVLATARSPRGVEPIFRMLATSSPSIVCNGAMTWNHLERKAVHHEPLDGDLAAAAIRLARERDSTVLVGVEVVDRWHTDRRGLQPAGHAALLAEPDSVGSLDAILSQPVTKLSLWGEPARIVTIAPALREQLADRAKILLSDRSLIQVLHPQVDKGRALRQLAAGLGLEPEDVMAIGDAENDAGMMEWAGFCVAPANASPQILAIADAVVPASDADGVAVALRKFVLSGPG